MNRLIATLLISQNCASHKIATVYLFQLYPPMCSKFRHTIIPHTNIHWKMGFRVSPIKIYAFYEKCVHLDYCFNAFHFFVKLVSICVVETVRCSGCDIMGEIPGFQQARRKFF